MKYTFWLFITLVACQNQKEPSSLAVVSPDREEIVDTLVPKEDTVKLEDLRLFYLSYDRRDTNGLVNVFITDLWPRHDTNLIIEEKYFEGDFGNRNYHHLDERRSQIVLDSVRFTERDTLTIFNMKGGVMARYAVTDLQVIAQANPYDIRPPHSYWAFRVGFEIPGLNPTDTLLRYESLVHIGEKQPFIEGGVRPMIWEELSAEEVRLITKDVDLSWTEDTTLLPIYHHAYEGWHIFYNKTNYKPENRYPASYEVWATHDDSTGILSTTYLFDGESQSPAPIFVEGGNTRYDVYQWCGTLFKGQPPVITNLIWESFGCPYVAVMKGGENRVWIHCDNWH